MNVDHEDHRRRLRAVEHELIADLNQHADSFRQPSGPVQRAMKVDMPTVTAIATATLMKRSAKRRWPVLIM